MVSTKILSSTTVFNIDDNRKSFFFLSTISAFYWSSLASYIKHIRKKMVTILLYLLHLCILDEHTRLL